MLTTEEKNLILDFPYAMYTPEGDAAVAKALLDMVEVTPDSDNWVSKVMHFVTQMVEDEHPEVGDTAVRDQIFEAISKVVSAVWLRQLFDSAD